MTEDFQQSRATPQQSPPTYSVLVGEYTGNEYLLVAEKSWRWRFYTPWSYRLSEDRQNIIKDVRALPNYIYGPPRMVVALARWEMRVHEDRQLANDRQAQRVIKRQQAAEATLHRNRNG